MQRVGPGQYLVAGNVEPCYVVDLSQDVPCQCKDAEYNGRPCLHELSARLQEREPALLAAFGEMLAARQRASGDEDEDETTRFPHGEP